MVRKKNEAIPRVSMPDVDYEYTNISSLAQYITTRPGLVDSKEPCKLITMPSKNASVTVALRSDDGVALSRSITQYDATVMDAVYSLFINGCVRFTPEMVARMISGRLEGCISPQKIGAVSKSLNKLRHVDITIDLTDEYIKTGGILEPGERITKTSYLLPLEVYNAVIPDNGKKLKTKETKDGDEIIAGYEFIKRPVLYTYAESKGEIEQFPTKLLSAAKMSDTDDNIAIKWYLIRRIGALKKARNKTILKDVIYYDTEERQGAFKDLSFFEENFANWREKKKKIHTSFVKVLDAYKEEEYIKDYTVLYEGKSPIGIEIQISSEY